MFENGQGEYWKQQGQKFYLDQSTGSAVIDSGDSTQSLDYRNNSNFDNMGVLSRGRKI